MRDLAALNIYAMEEFELAKTVVVKTAETCVKEEEKVLELRNAIADLKKNKVEYKNDRMVEKVVNRLDCAINFLVKASGAFSSVTDAVNEKRDALTKKRAENLAVLDESKSERKAVIAKGKAAEVVAAITSDQEAPKPEKRKAGRPKGKK